MNQKNKYYMLLIVTAVILSLPGKSIAQIYQDSTATIEARVSDLLSIMTLDEKIGQMVQEEYTNLNSSTDIQTYFLGSILTAASDGPPGQTPEAWVNLSDSLQAYSLKTRLKIPLLIAMDAVHGTGSVYGATLFPHNIGMGCTRNPGLLTQEEQITAEEMSAVGFNWTFGPVVAVARNENWGRTYESFGEDPTLIKEMAAAAVIGFQGDTSARNINVLACAKHFVGDGGTTNGADAGNTQVDTATLRAIHLPGYISAIEQKVGSVMASFSSWNNVFCVANKYLLTTLLKEELKFDGLIITDFDGATLAPGRTIGEQFNNSINAGIDMVMVNGPLYLTFIDSLKASVGQGKVSLARIDDAVKRILTQKFRLGLFEHPYAKRSLLNQVGSPEHRQVARECVRKSLVVLKKKDGILPVSKNIKHIHMAGRHANNMGYQCGGWTITWQGGSGNTTIGTTIMQAVQQVAPSAEVTYSENGFGADSADIGIAVIGELPYAEGIGDKGVTLATTDVQTIRNLKSFNIPVIVILISGRPMIINPILHHCDALVAAWLPGTEGEGITDVLFGDIPPTGVLSRTWPKDISQIPMNVGDAVYNPLFEYGYGITSLNNSPAGSPPEVYSASVGTIQSIEISFNKKIALPSAAPGGFSAFVNRTTPLNITHLSLKKNDSTTIILTLDSNLVKGNSYTISYSPGSIHSYDGGQLAAFDTLSVYNILNDYSYIHNIPKKIEAEEYITRQGMNISSSSDVDGGDCLSNIKNGNWVDYYASVSQTGIYVLNYRISSTTDTGQIQLVANGKVVSTLNLPNTGSWTTWQTVSTTVELTEGLQVIRMYASHGGFRLNWMQFSLITGVEDRTIAPQSFLLYQNYPNPFNPSTTIKYQVPKTSRVNIKIFDLLGRELAVLVNEEKLAGRYEVHWDASTLPSGVYFYRLSAIPSVRQDLIQTNGQDGQIGSFSVTKKLVLLR